MSKVPKRVIDRFNKKVGKFKRVLKNARNIDLNEADTVTIIGDMLSEVFGFDKYAEITGEYAIRNTYCDLAIRVDGNIKYLIEVKAIGLDLSENHIRQAVNYGATEGIRWAVLTNGLYWDIYHIKLKKKVTFNRVCHIDFLNLNLRKSKNQEELFLLCKEGLRKAVIDEYHERMKVVNRFILGAILQYPRTLGKLRTEIRRLSPGLKIDENEISSLLINGVLKREVLEGERAHDAKKWVKKVNTKLNKK